MDDANSRVTTRMLRDAITDTRELLRAEMARLADRLDRHERKLEDICAKLSQPPARPVRRFLGVRLVTFLDKTAPLGIVAFITWLLTHV